jgi:hypothetical protein
MIITIIDHIFDILLLSFCYFHGELEQGQIPPQPLTTSCSDDCFNGARPSSFKDYGTFAIIFNLS